MRQNVLVSGLVKPYAVFYPMIVLDGDMFEIIIDGEDIQVTRKYYIPYIFSGSTSKAKSYLIEIVHIDYLEEFLGHVTTEIQEMMTYLRYLGEKDGSSFKLISE